MMKYAEETQLQNYVEEEDDDDDEALSLRNLPLVHHQSSQENQQHISTTPLEAQDDFYFCFPSEESQMRAADEIFFRGQILPFHYHNSSISRSQSMDRHHYFSSRSTSSSSQQSSSTTTTGGGGSTNSLPPRNQFHSQPSPSPKILRSRQHIIRNNNRNCEKKSFSWNVFRGGLIAAPPKITFRDVRTRRSVGGGRDSGGSKKKRGKAWGIIGGGGGCKCSVETVDDCTIAREIAFVKRSAFEKDDKSLNQRTTEWLKLLSLQPTSSGER